MTSTTRELVMLAVALAAGFLLGPILVFLVGQAVFGPYGDGAGMTTFFTDFRHGLAAGQVVPWLMLLAPYLLLQWLRLLALPLRRTARHDDVGEVPEIET